MEKGATFSEGVKIVIAKRFYNEALAHLYKSKLKDQGIESFISNATTSTLIPFGDGGFTLHVRQSDLEEVNSIIQEVDTDLSYTSDQDFRDADHDDIQYEKEVWEYENKLKRSSLSKSIFYIILLILFMVALSYFLYY